MLGSGNMKEMQMQNEQGAARQSNRDWVVNPGEHAYMQDTTKGAIKTHTGPIVINQTGQEQPVIFDEGKFRTVSTIEEAVRQAPRAGEGDYIVLENPAENASHPEEAAVSNLPNLRHGCKVNIPGPDTFALWPGQTAKVIKGHHLRSNQFLLVRVYNEEEARKNWGKAVVKQAAQQTGSEGDDEKGGKGGKDGKDAKKETSGEATILSKAESLDLTIGQRLIIRGTDVSFYMPPTGVEVVPDENGSYVRDAVTLERLEYSILIDEDGNKRYEQGPKVVFPEPTEEFWTEGGKRKFKAVELNKIQGIHVKVIAPYEESGKKYKEGDEIFLTGKDCAIYYPRPEHSIIQYGDRMKHYAVAVPAGEGRYVMNRENGEIKTDKGPEMLLPNPVTHVIVRRVLSDKQVSLWYPGNVDALSYNRNLRAVSSEAGLEGSAGHVTEQVYTSSLRQAYGTGNAAYFADAMQADEMDADYEHAIPGGIRRGTKFTRPRELTLDTKYDGVPVICPWTGYAVMVVSKTGDRQVVVGPKTILMGYDEDLEVLTVSTGKPKNTDNLKEIVYLRVKNNKVSDIVEDVMTKDHVSLNIKLSFRVDFEGEPERWFEVENYVKFLCDHVRSMLKGSIRRMDIEEFYGDGVAVVRDIILGKHEPIGGETEEEGEEPKTARPGLFFEENGMRVVDVEVLMIQITDARVRDMLEDAQFEAVSGNILLAQAEKALKITCRQEDIKRQKAKAEAQTVVNDLKLEAERISEDQKVQKAHQDAKLARLEKDAKLADADEAVLDLKAERKLSRDKAVWNDKLKVAKDEQAMRIEELEKEAKLTVERFGAMQNGFSEALLALSSQDTMAKIAEALSVQQLIGGRSVADVLCKVFHGTSLEGMMGELLEKASGSGFKKVAYEEKSTRGGGVGPKQDGTGPHGQGEGPGGGRADGSGRR